MNAFTQINMLYFEENGKKIRNIYAEFLQECPNGKMDKKAFIKFYKKIDETKGTDTVCNGVFSVLDTDQNGTIDFGEFLLAVGILSPGDLDIRLDFMFDMCDVSNDGYVDKKEFSNWITVAVLLVQETKKQDNMGPRAMGLHIPPISNRISNIS
ncbi:unnamed protein product [Rotaria sordida]|uniref:EF-hand domain-containing protein n=1 Tax=Rotaria sordida TaxID=392033 RepID=A0A815CLH2_9BILA|nr:unnamed protein product [Rotaria sordida]